MELLVPKSRGGLIAVVIFTAVVVTFGFLAVRNLVQGVALVPSGIWLLLIAFGIVSNIRDSGGLRGFALSVLDAFSRTQVLVLRTLGDSKTLDVGFKLFGSNFARWRIPASDLVSIRWSKGQASDMAGRDANDWSVALWYAHGDPEKEAKQRERQHRRPDQTVLIIGPQRAKAVTEALGQRIVSFLRDGGVSIVVEEP